VYVALYSTELVIQITRLLREETLLNKDQTYRDYASQVRYRLVSMVF
jgi:protein-S-isoprenylcysteine O-methyltransferase Ste14